MCHDIHFRRTVVSSSGQLASSQTVGFPPVLFKIYSKWKHPKRTSKRLKRNIIHKHLIFYISITKYYPSLRNLTDGIMHFFTLKHFHIHTSNHNSLKEIKNLLTIIHCTSVIFFLKLLKMLTCWINECCKYQLNSIQLKHNENVQCANFLHLLNSPEPPSLPIYGGRTMKLLAKWLFLEL